MPPGSFGTKRSTNSDLPLVLNYQAFLKRCLGQPDLAEKILAKFSGRLLKNVAEIEAALNRGDLAEVSGLAHQLKGAAGNVSADPLYAIAVELETLGKNGDKAAAAACLVRLGSESKRFIAETQQIVASERIRRQSQLAPNVPLVEPLGVS